MKRILGSTTSAGMDELAWHLPQGSLRECEKIPLKQLSICWTFPLLLPKQEIGVLHLQLVPMREPSTGLFGGLNPCPVESEGDRSLTHSLKSKDK